MSVGKGYSFLKNGVRLIWGISRNIASIEFSKNQVLFLLLIFALGANPAFAARSVALVYDDSGSMGDRHGDGDWRYANYALQGLIAFLGDDDDFYLVVMSDPNNVKRYTGQQAKHQLVEDLKRSKPPVNGTPTPYEAIKTARNSLKIGEKNHEKWLVVITDGTFKPKPSDSIVKQEAEDFLQSTAARTAFLLIGKESDKVFAEILRHSSQAIILQADNSDAIIERLYETAALMTSHNAKSVDLHALESERTLQIIPKFPLRRLTVFIQSKDKKTGPPEIQTVTVQKESGRLDPYRLSLIAGSRKKDRSESAIVHLTPTPPTTLIDVGKDQINISFNQNIKDFEYKLYPEVAAKLDIQLGNSKADVLAMHSDQPIEVCEDALLSLHAKLITDSGKTLTETQSDIGQFDVSYLLDVGAANAMQINPDHTEFTAQFKPNQGTSTVSVKAAYPGYFDLRSQIYTLRTVDCKPRTISILSDTSSWNESLMELPSSKVLLTAKVDGQTMQGNEFVDAEMSILSDTDVKFNLVKDEQNHQWQLLPQFTWGCACFTPTGEQKVEVLLKGAREDEQGQHLLSLKVADVTWWKKCGNLVITAIILLLSFWYLFGIIKKPRFRQGSIVKYTRGHRTQTEHLPSGWASRWLIPFIPEKRVIGSVLFMAGVRSSYILLSNKTQNTDMTINGLPIDEPGRRDVRLSNLETLEINARQSEHYTYSSSQ